MPIIKQAIKKLRHDRVVTLRREKMKNIIKTTVKKARKTPTQKTIAAAFTVLDKATKTHIVHKNKASRLKSRLSKLLVK